MGKFTIKIKHPGQLHRDMGIAQDKPISTSAMEKAKAGASPAEKKRIVFAENAKHWNHKKAGPLPMQAPPYHKLLPARL